MGFGEAVAEARPRSEPVYTNTQYTEIHNKKTQSCCKLVFLRGIHVLLLLFHCIERFHVQQITSLLAKIYTEFFVVISYNLGKMWVMHPPPPPAIFNVIFDEYNFSIISISLITLILTT